MYVLPFAYNLYSAIGYVQNDNGLNRGPLLEFFQDRLDPRIPSERFGVCQTLGLELCDVCPKLKVQRYRYLICTSPADNHVSNWGVTLALTVFPKVGFESVFQMYHCQAYL